MEQLKNLLTILAVIILSLTVIACGDDDDDDDDDDAASVEATSGQDASTCIDDGEAVNALNNPVEFSAIGSCSDSGNSITVSKVEADKEEVKTDTYIRVTGSFNLATLAKAKIQVQPAGNGTAGPCDASIVKGDGTFVVDAHFSNVPNGQEDKMRLVMFDAKYDDSVGATAELDCTFDLELQ